MSDSLRPAEETLNRKPQFGCVIMAIGLIIFGGLIVYVISLPFKQGGEMQKFTTFEPNSVQLTAEAQNAPSPALKAKLNESLTAIQSAEEPITLTYNAAELNEIIRSYVEFKELQGTFGIREITEEEMLIDISFKLRKMPFADETPYLEGTMHAQPVLEAGEYILKATKIDSPHGTVPEGFVQHLESYRIMIPYEQHEVIAPLMASTTELKLVNGAVQAVIDSKKFQTPNIVELTKPKKESRSKRLINMALVSFLVTGALFFYFKKRKK